MHYADVIKEKFDKDIENHTMEILRDDGLDIHLRFSNGGSCFYKFEIITWDGGLCFTGDVGTFVFRVAPDMFRFFRGDTVNIGYWHEKLVAVDSVSGSVAFSNDAFVEVLEEYIESWVDEQECGLGIFENSAEIELVRQSLMEMAEAVEFEHEAYQHGGEWEYEGACNTFELTDLWEHTYQRFTGRYVWCCYALVWAIKQYDKVKENEKTDII